jgi:hypothetical protein
MCGVLSRGVVEPGIAGSVVCWVMNCHQFRGGGGGN